MMDRLGQQLGNYSLKSLIAQGTFAEVYQGEHTLLGTTVAIKVLHTEVTQKNVAKFQQEACLLAGLKHPHIIRVLDFGLNKETPYLVMDYAPNGTLRTRHAKGTPLPVSTVVGYVKQIANALQYAHDRKVVHRDIKPENMLIDEKNEILLGDFGIALIAQSSCFQPTQDIIGTLPYMSPEQIHGKPRAASDQYSLGIVVYEWLSGMYPFQGSLTELCTQHMFASPSSLHERVSTISPEVERVVTTALAKDPKQRFESVQAFATALEQASQGILPTERVCPLNPSSTFYALPSLLHTDVLLFQPAKRPIPRPQRLVTFPPASTVLSDRLVLLSESELQTLPALPMPAEKTVRKPQASISRRAVLLGAAGAATIAAVGVGVFAITTARPVTPQVPQKQLVSYQGHSGSVHGMAWSPLDGKRIASCSFDKTVQVWNASDGGRVFTYTGHSDRVQRVAWSPLDEKRIASGSSDRTVQVWDASDGGNVFTYKKHTDAVTRVAWSPLDEKWIASGSADHTVQVWNASDGGSVFTYKKHTDAVYAVAWSPDGRRLASGSADRTVQVWNASGGNNAFTYQGHSDSVFEVAWSPDGERIASGSADQTVQVWNARNGGYIYTYRGHTRTVRGVSWSPDGKQIASCSEDGTVQVWNASDGSNVFTYRGHSNWVLTVAWSPDGKRIASGSRDKTVQVWYVR